MSPSAAAPLEEEIAYYEANRDQLLGTHREQFVLIKGSQLVEVFASAREALDRGYDLFGNAPFLVRQCLEVRRPVLFTSL